MNGPVPFYGGAESPHNTQGKYGRWGPLLDRNNFLSLFFFL